MDEEKMGGPMSPFPTVSGDAHNALSSGKIKPYRMRGRYGILNPYGDLWTCDTFNTVIAAKNYVTEYWKAFPGQPKTNPSDFEIVEVNVTVSFAKRLERQP